MRAELGLGALPPLTLMGEDNETVGHPGGCPPACGPCMLG